MNLVKLIYYLDISIVNILQNTAAMHCVNTIVCYEGSVYFIIYIYTEINTDCFLKHKRGMWGGGGERGEKKYLRAVNV